MENILYLGGPNIASEIYNKEYANTRICGAEKWRKPLATFLRQPHFIVWDNGDLVTHEVMGGLKNVYAIGAGTVLVIFTVKLYMKEANFDGYLLKHGIDSLTSLLVMKYEHTYFLERQSLTFSTRICYSVADEMT